MASGFDFLLNDPINIWKHCNSLLNYVLKSKFGCMATVLGLVEDNQAFTPMKAPALVPEKRFEVLVSRVKVSVHKGDLTTFPVDAVVNAANERLQHLAGLALALSNAGGSQIQLDSKNYVRNFGVLKTGEAVVMNAGFLPCKKIIHTVGPQVTGHSLTKSAERDLEKAVLNSLRKAEECSMNSVALPAISSGIFGYPLKECADTIVRSVRMFCEKQKVFNVKEILLVNNDDSTVDEMERACQRIFSTNPTSSKTANTNRNSAHTVQLQTVRLTLKRGLIEQEKTSVIVNTTEEHAWYNGHISNAILTNAGPKMHQALESTSAIRNIIVTGPYKLHCAKVYHTLCKNRSAYKACEILSYAILDCLQLAGTQSHQSIAFPAIGTGGLGFCKEEVAHIMTEAVFNFAATSSKQMEVYFVIHPSDHITFKVFEDKMRSLQQRTFNPRPTNAVPEKRDDFNGSGAATAQIRLTGSSEESMQEAHEWLRDILLHPSKTRIVQNNFITHFGEEEYMQLSSIMRNTDTSIKELLKLGQASIVLSGNSLKNVVVAFLEVEKILCKIQREIVEEEQNMLSNNTNQHPQYRRCPVPHLKGHISKTLFLNSGLEIVKVESVENPTLMMLFELKKRQLKCFTTRKMLQLIPAHFCDMVSCIGFQAEIAPPDEPAHGQGIYFTGTVSKAMDMWTQTFSKYLYFVEAEVLTGKSTSGKPDLILPPPVGADPLVRYDSVSGGQDISVIFTGYQALPVHIITCERKAML